MFSFFCGSKKTKASEIFLFDRKYMLELGEKLAAQFQAAKPYPHIVIDDFLPTEAAERILEVFPDPSHSCWLDWTKRDTKHQPYKLGLGSAERLDDVHPYIHTVLSAINSHSFVMFLERLTGINGILPDPHFAGGMLHQILPKGTLSVHADFNYYPHIKLYRRVNTLLYLNKNWKPEYGGYLEIWSEKNGLGDKCEHKIEPKFNRCVIFRTDHNSFHGHPDALACPDGMTRKSIAAYHYTVDSIPGQEEARGTNWQDVIDPT